ncbi:hypothetical protein VTA80_18720 [Pengzhenrongella phosphoraccumulans]
MPGHPLPLLRLAEEVDVEPQRGDGGPQPVRQVGHQLAFDGEQAGDSRAEAVQHAPDRRDLRWTRGLHPGGELAGSQAFRHVGEIADGTRQSTRDPVPGQHGASEQHRADRRQDEPGLPDPGGELGVGDERAHDRQTRCAPDGEEHLDPAVGLGREGEARRRDLGGGRPRGRLAHARGVGKEHGGAPLRVVDGQEGCL